MELYRLQEKATHFGKQKELKKKKKKYFHVSVLRFKMAVLYSVVKGKLYLFGGSCYAEAKECPPGVYCFDVGKHLSFINIVMYPFI